MFNALLGALVALAVAIPASICLARRAVARTRALETQARNAERWAHIGKLAGGLAHEIKNPLSTLNMNLQLMEEDWGDMESADGRQLRSRIDMLRKEVRRLEEILNDFLRFARGPEIDLVQCDLNTLLDEVVDFIAPEALSQEVHVRKSYADDLPACRLDVDLMKQALLNLIINAEQAMPEGGELMVRTTRNGAHMTVDITDTGVGIPEDKLEEVFQVYVSTKKGGTGLGLPTARRIIEDHGGRISVQSEVGKGTNFQVQLPIPEEPPSELAPEEAEAVEQANA